MKITVRYENKRQTFEIDIKELEKWLNISMEEGESQEDYEKRIQEEVDSKYNRPDYNNWHKHNRHFGDAMFKNKDGKIEINSEEAIKEKAVDESIYTGTIKEIEDNLDYEYYSNFIRENLKPKAADMVIAIVLKGKSVGEYAESIGDKPNNVSHRFRRALNQLKKLF